MPVAFADGVLLRVRRVGSVPEGDGRKGDYTDRRPPLRCAAMTTAQQRREELKLVFEQARGCTLCPQLAATRTQVVFGAGNADADLMFVGEAPGANEDRQGLPFVGQAGKLLEQLLGEIGLTRAEVFIANTLKCRPPGNRDPHPVEIENCQPYLMRQLELIQPKVVCTLGNFATKLLRGDPAGITRVHGRDEVRVLGRRAVRVLPIYHPAAALYTPRMLEALRADFARLPQLLALDAPPQPADEEPERLPTDPLDAPRAVPPPAERSLELGDAPGPPPEEEPPAPDDDQLGLF
jgi:uracil-DNA glycosylase